MGVARCRPTVAEIDLPACVRNLRRLREHVSPKDIWAVVKADAYGHGAVAVARALDGEGVAGFCVATTTGGRALRQAGIAQPILVMPGLVAGGEQDPARTAVEYGLSTAVQDRDAAEILSSAARSLGIGPASVHLKVDTGMSRLGVLPEHALALARHVDADPTLSLEGVFSNLATADAAEADAAGCARLTRQVESFAGVCTELEQNGLHAPHRHLANSAGALQDRRSWDSPVVTAVRPGIALYGASLTPGRDPVDLEPVMRIRTRIGAVRHLPEGAWVGYGSTAQLRRPSRIAVLPVGYHDGWPRALGNRAQVLLRGRRAPVIGRLSMDVTLVDVTDISAARPGDSVWLLGGPTPAAETTSHPAAGSAAAAATRQPVRVEEVAAWAQTIPHEILSRVGVRLPRIIADDAVSPTVGTGRQATSPRSP